ncbi:MAG: helix-turn-helix domain-containing protein [bacterium]
MTDKVKIAKSSGNIFEDLGLPDSEERLAKTKLTSQIAEIIRKRKLTQTQAAAQLGINQPKVSALLKGNLAGFSTDRLIRFLNLLGRDVNIVIKPKPRSQKYGHVRVNAI